MNYDQHYLTPLFEPQSVAIIGASESPNSIGAIMARNMLDNGFKGKLFFVNPKHDTIFGQTCYASVESIPQRLDLAVICTPASTVASIVEACGRAGVKSAIINSGGFSESGRRGASYERNMLENARRYKVRLLGPNSLGIMRPNLGVNLTFSHSNANPGSMGLVSQSGALCTAILDWALPNNVGFSSVVSLGGSSDVDFGEILDYLVADEKTENIFLYIEGIKNSRRFMSALRAAARVKPVLLIKVGRHPAGERAAFSHTGALVGADDVFAAALRRAGVVRLATIDQMYASAQALFSHFRPRGNRIAIITNGGGPGVMAADYASDLGLPLAQLGAGTMAKLSEVLPDTWSRANPIDIVGDADPARYAAALNATLADPDVDGVLVILTPQAMTDPIQVAREVIQVAHQCEKPIFACWMGEQQVRAARLLFKEAMIPNFRSPEPGVELFSHIANYYRNQKLLMQAPASAPASDQTPARIESAALVIETALQEGRKKLNPMESKALLAAFRIPIAQTVVARSPTEAMVLAEEIGLPVVMKVDSIHITNKSESGGVRLNLNTLSTVREAYHSISEDVRKHRPDAIINGIAIEPMVVKPNGRDLMVGIVRDQIFGPTVVFGPGGASIDDPTERTVALPPLNKFLVDDMLRSNRAVHYLGEFRSMPPVKMEALEGVLLRISEMACELPWIQRLDINPLIVDENGAVAVGASIEIDNLPLVAGRYDHMAIHPYPSQLESRYQSDLGPVTIRPIRPEDSTIEHEFVKNLSPQSKYFRFMNTLRELSSAQLVRFTQIDYDREMAFIAIIEHEGREIEIGVARYVTNPDAESCEFAIVVADDWQGRGLARRLMGVIIDTARARGLRFMNGDFLSENQRMIRFVSSLGFVISAHPDDNALKRGVLVLN